MPTYLEDEIIKIAAKAGAEAAIQKELKRKKNSKRKSTRSGFATLNCYWSITVSLRRILQMQSIMPKHHRTPLIYSKLCG